MTRRMAGVLLIAFLSTGIGAIGQGKLQPGDAAPAFNLPDLNGKQFSSAELKGNVVLLDLWATWCEPCIADLPIYKKFFERYGSRGLRVVGIAVESGWAKDIQPHVAKHGIRYPVLVGDENVVGAYQLIGFPTTYLIDRDGKIAKKYIGTLDGKEAQKESDMEREIQRLLDR